MIVIKSPRQCPCAVAQEDAWEHIFSYCIPYEMCMLACSAGFLRTLVNKSEAWYILCQALWKNKQYHPLERWVRLRPVEDKQVIKRTIFDRIEVEETIESLMNDKIKGFEKQKEELLKDIELLSLPENDLARSLKIEMLNMVDGQLKACNNFRQIVVAKINKLKKHAESSQDDSVTTASQERLACPISRAVRTEWIQLECEYFSTLESRDIAEAKLSALSNGTASGGYSKILSNQIVFDSLLNQVTELQRKADVLKQTINKNISRKVNLSVELANAAANGTLLSWKDSYFASIVDSKRTTITAAELREMGECITFLKGSPCLQKIRFIRGGHCITDNNSFKNTMGWFEISKNEFCLPQLSSTGSVSRVDSDWGWEFSCYKGTNKIASFDRLKGFDEHEGVLSHAKDGTRNAPPVELSGGLLLNGHHPTGLYTLETV